MRMLYFAWVRELVGVDEERVSPPPEVVTVADLVRWLAARSEGHARALADPARLRAAVDQAFVPLDAAVRGAGEVALFPPVTGG
ncbi:MAG TPA: molybdopterin converting factor subunit 1 [Sphingomonas sp.]|jgi:molybdopterin synthase sulfur carrier subunit|uniref:molybdopterin converting factor subunit 1 n=1 Tax=Sphingomonas sp. TaxID=28214 RepID=UPI002ED78AB2